MERRKEEPVSALVARFLRLAGLETPLREHRLIEAWPNVCEPRIAQATQDLRIYNQRLYVRLSSPALRTLLTMQRTHLVQRLNDAAGGPVITDIVVQ